MGALYEVHQVDPAARQLGLIVNPVAGIGGRVGLKGSDGDEIQRLAREMGAQPQAQERAILAVKQLTGLEGLQIVTYPGEMGETVVGSCGLEPHVIGRILPGKTSAQDTQNAARAMRDRGVDLLLFAGGDGTARDVYEAVGLDVPVIGIPAGVKIHSAVYATSPVHAGQLAALYLEGQIEELRESEVMDIDEDAVRCGRVSATLYGYLKVPHRGQLVQSLKMPSDGELAALESIALDVITKMEEGRLYLVGPGTTTRAIVERLSLPKTLIGVDVIQAGGFEASGERTAELIAADANEDQLLALLGADSEQAATIVVTLIGGQGYVFGRGNQQLSSNVIQAVAGDGRRPWENIMVVSTPEKLHTLGRRPLLVDTGDIELDELMTGYITVITGYNERAVRKVSC